MKLPARYQAVIELLEQSLVPGSLPVDFLLRSFFRERRYIGSTDRRMIGDIFFSILRCQPDLEFFLDKTGFPVTGRLLVLCFLCLESGEGFVDDVFSGQGYGPACLGDAEQKLVPLIMENRELLEEFRLPEFLSFLKDVYPPEFFQAFREKAPLDLRVNTLLATREKVLEDMRALGIKAEPTPHSPWGIRLANRIQVEKLDLYRDGYLEVQDEGSQLAGMICAPQKDEKVLDLCAGGGGKTLHMAALMENHGEIIATDINDDRLAKAELRLRRAGVCNVRLSSMEKASMGLYDCVLVDAPCSGSGTWRRKPDAVKKLDEKWFRELLGIQKMLLQQAACLTRKGGRIVYVTCSFIPAENEEQIKAFLEVNPLFEKKTIQIPGLCANGDLKLSPFHTGTDGFFGSVMIRKA